MYIKVLCFTASGNAPSFKIFGKRLLQLYPSLLRNNFHSVPSFALLDVSQQAIRLTIAVRKSYSVFLKLYIKHKIALSWKSAHRPSKRIWVERLLQNLALEKLLYAIKGRYNIFVKIWGSFMEFLKRDDFMTAL